MKPYQYLEHLKIRLEIRFDDKFGPRINRHKIKKLQKKLPEINKKIELLQKESRKLQKELQRAYFRDSMEKIKEEGRI